MPVIFNEALCNNKFLTSVLQMLKAISFLICKQSFLLIGTKDKGVE